MVHPGRCDPARASAQAAALTLGDVERVLGAAPAADAEGVAAFGVECRQALATLRLRARHLPAAPPPGPWLGASGSICYDAVAAARPHPAYPSGACRLGFTDELAGSVTLTRLLAPVFAELGRRFPGTVLLGEPGYRTVALASRDAYEGLAVIVRDGVRARTAPHVTPLLAASLTEPAARLFDGRDCDWLAAWWRAYVRLVAPPVLGAFFGHGVVLEPHMQNVLIGVDDDGWPTQVLFRDLEGTKLVSSRHAALLAGLPPGVARGLAYDTRRGWDRVAYCLLVNHLAEVAAAIADRSPTAAACERELWRQARHVLIDAAAEHGWPPELRAVLAGVPLPAKANLRVRWARDADRDAGYVQVPNPLRQLEPCQLEPCQLEPGRLEPSQLEPRQLEPA